MPKFTVGDVVTLSQFNREYGLIEEIRYSLYEQTMFKVAMTDRDYPSIGPCIKSCIIRGDEGFVKVPLVNGSVTKRGLILTIKKEFYGSLKDPEGVEKDAKI